MENENTIANEQSPKSKNWKKAVKGGVAVAAASVIALTSLSGCIVAVKGTYRHPQRNHGHHDRGDRHDHHNHHHHHRGHHR